MLTLMKKVRYKQEQEKGKKLTSPPSTTLSNSTQTVSDSTDSQSVNAHVEESEHSHSTQQEGLEFVLESELDSSYDSLLVGRSLREVWKREGLGSQYEERLSYIKASRIHRADILKAAKIMRNYLGVPESDIDKSRIVSHPKVEERKILPRFLASAIAASTSFNVIDLIEDLHIGLSDMSMEILSALNIPHPYSALVRGNEDSFKYLPKIKENQDNFISLLREGKKEIQDNEERYRRSDSSSEDGKDLKTYSDLYRVYARMDNKESDGMQLLFGMPFTYNLLMEGHHYGHPEQDWLGSFITEEVNNLMQCFSVFSDIEKKRYAVLSVDEVKLPIGTSQGLLLKSSRDTPGYRGFSKLLLASIASQCDSQDELFSQLSKIGACFKSRGYYDPCKDAFLGLRRMHMKPGRPEPFFSSSRDKEPSYYVQKTQGRSRAIFPFSEAIKYYYKRLADPLKKNLFSDGGCFSVDPKLISVGQKRMLDKFLSSPELCRRYEETGDWVCAYDLSAYDTSVCKFINDLYNKCMQAIIPDGIRRWGDGHNRSGVLFLDRVQGFDDDYMGREGVLMFDDIYGRSTLSGQADVTLKNNVIHFCLLSAFLKGFFSLNDEKLRRMMIELISKGECTLNASGKLNHLVLHLHGDDVFFYFSDNPSDYDSLAAFFTRFGIKTGFESGPIYLKKVPHPENPSKLMNLAGSLLKNRLGEYSKPSLLMYLLGVIDNIQLEVYLKNDRLTKLHLDRNKNELAICQVILDSLETDVDELRDIKRSFTLATSDMSFRSLELLKRDCSVLLSRLIARNDPRSTKIRKSLSAEVYKTSRDAIGIVRSMLISDKEAGTNREYSSFDEGDPSDLADMLASYSLKDRTLLALNGTFLAEFDRFVDEAKLQGLVRLAISIQNYLLDNDGRVPSFTQISDYMLQIKDDVDN